MPNQNNTSKSEIRKDYLLDKYVIITPGRALRPRDIKEQTIIKRSKECYFCPDNVKKQQEDMGNYIIDEIKEKGKWQVVTVRNIFPAVYPENKDAYGYQEVIIENRHHSRELAVLDSEHVEKVLKMYAKRTSALQKDKNIEYILCFKNQGSKAGASIVHAHSQVFATQILPPEIQNELHLAQLYKTEHGNCFYCDLIEKEMKGKRKIYEDDHVVAFTPYASEYHYEAWIFTKRHLDNITKLNEEEFQSFSQALKMILNCLRDLDLSFNYFLHQVVSNDDQHFYLKIQPRGSVWAGVELGSGLVINSISPELAAKYYRGEINNDK